MHRVYHIVIVFQEWSNDQWLCPMSLARNVGGLLCRNDDYSRQKHVRYRRWLAERSDFSINKCDFYYLRTKGRHQSSIDDMWNHKPRKYWCTSDWMFFRKLNIIYIPVHVHRKSLEENLFFFKENCPTLLFDILNGVIA